MPYTQSEQVSRRLEFDQVREGDEAELEHLLTEADVQAFASLTGDFNPLHLDESFARKTSLLKPVVHGMLSASFISTMIGMFLPGSGALWTSQTLEFLNPAYVGDTLRVLARVKRKSPATQMLVLEIEIVNQRSQRLVAGQATVKMLQIRNEKESMNTKTAKTVLITGGSRGIGAATARVLAREGHSVVINYYRSQESAERLADEIVQAGGRAISVRADVALENEVKELFAQVRERIGSIDALVHCAASGSSLRPFGNLDWETILAHIDVQLKGAFNCVKAALPEMIRTRRGSIVLMGSLAADGTPPAQQTDYVVAKAAVSALARCLAVEYGPSGIRVNVVSPGMTHTDMLAHLPEKARMLMRMQTPLRRLAEPEDIADVIAFLVSEGARHITGETIRVCGGTVMM